MTAPDFICGACWRIMEPAEHDARPVWRCPSCGQEADRKEKSE